MHIVVIESLIHNHWTGIPHLEELESLGCLLLYKVDVHKMHTHPVLKNMKMHKNLVEAYFKSAIKMLSEGGEVHLRHRDDPPYDRWNVVLLAGKSGLTLKEKVDFEKNDGSSSYAANEHMKDYDIDDNHDVAETNDDVHGDSLETISRVFTFKGFPFVLHRIMKEIAELLPTSHSRRILGNYLSSLIHLRISNIISDARFRV
ncbi:hypothetical protein L1987_55491 [Smallanthus sonchifolius]|uniref:Uncharacterized protein n=1 Tax=Smallanthus sonchifolius TaxID=185202 RepID=A0ACB9EA08_9ASTR|nr:hypothetical protein L1987_55491 [Smallanthus sonchifolius]